MSDTIFNGALAPIFAPVGDVSLEGGQTILVAEDGATGIFAGGSDATVDIQGTIVTEGLGTNAAFAPEGDITLSGTVYVGGGISLGESGPMSSAAFRVSPANSLDIAESGTIIVNSLGGLATAGFFGGAVANAGTILGLAADTVGYLNFGGNIGFTNTGSVEMYGTASQAIVGFENVTIVNAGTLATYGGKTAIVQELGDGSAAIDLLGSGHTITNSGTIFSLQDNGIDIKAGEPEFDGNPLIEGSSSTITNEAGGVISGVIGIDGSQAIEIVSNAGSIVGDVVLKGGRDVYTATGEGSVDGTVSGGDGRDKLIGGDADDVLSGDAGKDLIDGGAGADTLDGGAGSSDVLSYANSAEAVSVTLVSGEAATTSGGDAEGDIAINFERIIGSDFNDTLSGDDGDNRLFGGDGDDILSGGGGDDLLVGQQGNDTFIFDGQGNDIIRGFGIGDDTLDLSSVDGLGSVSDLLAAATESTDGVLLAVGDGTVLLSGLTVSDINTDSIIL